MIKNLAIANCHPLLSLTIPFGQLNVIVDANGNGKFNLYRAPRVLTETAGGGVINALAKEGGLNSNFWAGPEKLLRNMQSGAVPIQGTVSQVIAQHMSNFDSLFSKVSDPKNTPKTLNLRETIRRMDNHQALDEKIKDGEMLDELPGHWPDKKQPHLVCQIS